ncbi:hypothetical protein C6381_03590 [Pseudomonas syringae pv. actinidiae]|nr:hypothetical protein C6381_03590 [Pseudomonas syringae pv. actinidiae]
MAAVMGIIRCRASLCSQDRTQSVQNGATTLERSALYIGPGEPGTLGFQASARRAWERTCSRRRYFRRYIFGDYTGPFANKFAPTASGQNQKQTCISR